MHATVSKRGLGFVPILLAAAVAGCGSGGESNSEAVSRVSAPASVGSVVPGSAAAIDACSLLSAEDVSTLLGVTVEGKSTTMADYPDAPGCMWENPANSESITVEIGGTDTAVNGTVPPPEPGFPELRTPGPDGMMLLGNGSVEFAAGGRDNTVQVAVLSMLGDEADAAAVELARKIALQLSQ